ncbi:MAG: dienelactone hydrolase family protein [Acidobacteria bacterium]|nr:dienelactone hydrolase family protein [Acidobacteriota bacterium]
MTGPVSRGRRALFTALGLLPLMVAGGPGFARPSPAVPGPGQSRATPPLTDLPVACRSLLWHDPDRDKHAVPFLLLHPCRAAGDDRPAPGGPWPRVICAHGFTLGAASLRPVAERLAAAGYVVALPDTETGFLPFPSHRALALDMVFLAERLRAESADGGSPLAGLAGEGLAFSGHSMGGGCAFLAAAEAEKAGRGPGTVAVMAPARTRPSSLEAARSLPWPVLVVAGQDDRVLSPAIGPDAHYAAAASPDKALLEIAGANHGAFALPHWAAALVEKGPAITAQTQQALTAECLRAWLDACLKGRNEAWKALTAALPSDPRFSRFQIGPGSGSESANSEARQRVPGR